MKLTWQAPWLAKYWDGSDLVHHTENIFCTDHPILFLFLQDIPVHREERERGWRRERRERGVRGERGKRVKRDKGKWWKKLQVLEAAYPHHLLKLKFWCDLKVGQWGKFGNVTRTAFCVEPERNNIQSRQSSVFNRLCDTICSVQDSTYWVCQASQSYSPEKWEGLADVISPQLV